MFLVQAPSLCERGCLGFILKMIAARSFLYLELEY